MRGSSAVSMHQQCLGSQHEVACTGGCRGIRKDVLVLGRYLTYDAGVSTCEGDWSTSAVTALGGSGVGWMIGAAFFGTCTCWLGMIYLDSHFDGMGRRACRAWTQVAECWSLRREGMCR